MVDELLHEEAVILHGSHFRIRIKTTDITSDGYDPEKPGYMVLGVEVLHRNGEEWDTDYQGTVKWNGCSNWDVTPGHICGPTRALILLHVYRVVFPHFNYYVDYANEQIREAKQHLEQFDWPEIPEP